MYYYQMPIIENALTIIDKNVSLIIVISIQKIII